MLRFLHRIRHVDKQQNDTMIFIILVCPAPLTNQLQNSLKNNTAVSQILSFLFNHPILPKQTTLIKTN